MDSKKHKSLKPHKKVGNIRHFYCLCCCCGHKFSTSTMAYTVFKGECPECHSLYFEADHPDFPGATDHE